MKIIRHTLDYADYGAFRAMRYSDQSRLLALPCNLVEIILKCFLEIGAYFCPSLPRSSRATAFLKAKTFTQCLIMMNPFKKADTLFAVRKLIDLDTVKNYPNSLDDAIVSSYSKDIEFIAKMMISSTEEFNKPSWKVPKSLIKLLKCSEKSSKLISLIENEDLKLKLIADTVNSLDEKELSWIPSYMTEEFKQNTKGHQLVTLIKEHPVRLKFVKESFNWWNVYNEQINSWFENEMNSWFERVCSEFESFCLSDNGSLDADLFMKILSDSNLTTLIYRYPQLIEKINDEFKKEEKFNIFLVINDLQSFKRSERRRPTTVWQYLNENVKNSEFFDKIWTNIPDNEELYQIKFLEDLLRVDFKLFSAFLESHESEITIQKIKKRQQIDKYIIKCRVGYYGNSTRDDRITHEIDDVIMLFLKINPKFLFLLDKEVVKDKYCILELYKTIPELKNNNLFFKELCKHSSIQYAENLIPEILIMNPSLYPFIHDPLKSDEKFNLDLLKECPEVWEFLSNELKNSPSFAAHAFDEVPSIREDNLWTVDLIEKCFSYFRSLNERDPEKFCYAMLNFQTTNFLKYLFDFINKNKLDNMNLIESEQCIKKNSSFLRNVASSSYYSHSSIKDKISDWKFQALYFYFKDGEYFKSGRRLENRNHLKVYDFLCEDLKKDELYTLKIIKNMPELWFKIDPSLYSIDLAIHALVHSNVLKVMDLPKKILDDLSLKLKLDRSTLMTHLLQSIIQTKSVSELMNICKKFLKLAESVEQEHVDVFISFLDTSCSLSANFLNEEIYKKRANTSFYKFFFSKKRTFDYWDEEFEEDGPAKIEDLASLTYGLTKTCDWSLLFSLEGINNLIAHEKFDTTLLQEDSAYSLVKKRVIKCSDDLENFDIESLHQLSNRLGRISCMLDAEVVYNLIENKSVTYKLPEFKKHYPISYFISLAFCHERKCDFKEGLEEFERTIKDLELMKALVKGDLRCFQFVLKEDIEGKEETWKPIIAASKDPQNFKKIMLTMLMINKKKGLKLNRITMNHILSWLQEGRLREFCMKNLSLR